jgi:capsular polysaccharide biosynthesis protein
LEPDNWGRWIVTVAPKIMHYKKHGAGRKFFCQTKLPWQRNFLNLFGVTDDVILEHHPGRTYICKDVMTVEHSDVNMTISENERMMFFEMIAMHRKPVKKFERLFISRLSRSIKSPHYRVLKNEVELAAMLAEFGFVSIEPETLPIGEQISMFAGAQHIVALGGAGIFNSVFCAPGTRFVTIESSDKFINAHAQLLSSLDLDYGIVFGSQIDPETGGAHGNWTLDIEGARQTLAAFIQ